MAKAPDRCPLFDRIAAACPEQPAVLSPAGKLTYGQLLSRTDLLSGRLAGDRAPVLVYGHKEPAMVIAFLAALHVGRPYVPVDPITPTARLLRIVELARPGLAVAMQPLPQALEADLRRRGVPVLALDPLGVELESEPARASGPAAKHAVHDREAPAYILFTSGTTGDPKGVPVPHRALEHFTSWLLGTQRFRLGEETFLNQAPFNFDLSVMDLYGALLTGSASFSITREEIADPRRLFARLNGAPLTVWVSTPSFARFCLAEPRFGHAMLPRLRCFLFCGETLPPSVVRQLWQRFPGAEVWNTYGPTETTVAVTAVRLTPGMVQTDDPLPVGRPAAGMDVWIADPADPLRRLPSGACGEIVIAGPQVALGYLQPCQDANVQAPPVGPFLRLPNGGPAYRTGDFGHIDSNDDQLYCAGRLDRQVKLHGYRLELEEVEAHLRRLPGVADAAVLAVDRGGQSDHLVALIVSSGDAALPANELALTQTIRAGLAEHLPDYALPRRARLLAAPPLTANGKLDRQALQALLR